MQTEKKVLVVRLSSLGDVLMTIPAVFSIKDAFPTTHISWLVEGPVSDFLSYQRKIDRIIKFPRGELSLELKKGNIFKAIKKIGVFLKELRAAEFDFILDFHGIIKSVILSRLSRGKKIIGFGEKYAKELSYLFYDIVIDGEDRRLHKVDRNMLIARYLGSKSDVPEIKLNVPAHYHEYIDDFFKTQGLTGDVFAVNPFSSSGSGFKRWDFKNYAILIRRISDELRAKTLILWGPGEFKEANRLKEEAGKYAYLACPTDISQLYALLQRVKVYISGDTGVMHLAAFAGTPVVAIFGPTDHKVNAPYGSKSITVRKDVPCSPCKKKNCTERKCLEVITVDDVFNAVKEIYIRTN
ncbi:MAG: glycosyltransferase family 9 protein [Syntrophorhabdaceae bacterium]|nr:glycosyltransferase family 9 protein [Syntrophorhabdaceae bacterium]